MSQHEEAAAGLLAMLDANDWPDVFWESYGRLVRLKKDYNPERMISEKEAMDRLLEYEKHGFEPASLRLSEKCLRHWISTEVPLRWIVPTERLVGRNDLGGGMSR